MKIGDAIEALQYFFLDLIGVIIPGAALVIGLGIIFKIPSTVLSLWPGAYPEVFLLSLSYVVGHMVSSIGEPTITLYSRLAGLIRRIPLIKRLVPDYIKNREEVIQDIQKSPSFVQFMGFIEQTPYSSLLKNGSALPNVNHWRDVAMTIAKDEKNTVYKFMFISLLTLGVCTALVVVALVWIGFSTANQLFHAQIDTVPIDYLILVAMIIASIPLFERYAIFYGRSIRVPFSMATAKLLLEAPSSTNIGTLPELTHGKRPKVYLAGGFRSNWQGALIEQIPAFAFYDPRTNERTQEDEYTVWDLEAIKNSHLIFAYLEKNNPAGYALSLEVGYAEALGKRIIFVDEKSTEDANIRKYLGMLYSCADITFTTFDAGVNYLRSLQRVFMDYDVEDPS